MATNPPLRRGLIGGSMFDGSCSRHAAVASRQVAYQSRPSARNTARQRSHLLPPSSARWPISHGLLQIAQLYQPVDHSRCGQERVPPTLRPPIRGRRSRAHRQEVHSRRAATRVSKYPCSRITGSALPLSEVPVLIAVSRSWASRNARRSGAGPRRRFLTTP